MDLLPFLFEFNAIFLVRQFIYPTRFVQLLGFHWILPKRAFFLVLGVLDLRSQYTHASITSISHWAVNLSSWPVALTAGLTHALLSSFALRPELNRVHLAKGADGQRRQTIAWALIDRNELAHWALTSVSVVHYATQSVQVPTALPRRLASPMNVSFQFLTTLAAQRPA